MVDTQKSFEGFLGRIGLDSSSLMVNYDLKGGLSEVVSNLAGDLYNGTLTYNIANPIPTSFDGESYIKVDDPENIYSPDFSVFLVYEKTSSDSQILFSSLQDGGSVKEGFIIGVTSNNKLFIEFVGEDGPVVFVSPYIFGSKNAICVSKFEDTFSLHLYNISDKTILTKSVAINEDHLLPSYNWYIGGIPSNATENGNFIGQIDHFVYFNEYLNSNVVRELFQSFYSTPSENTYIKTDQFSTQSVSGLTADYVSVKLSVLTEVDQYIQKKYLINQIGSLYLESTGSVDAFGVCNFTGNITGNLIKTETSEEPITKYIKNVVTNQVVSQNEVSLGTIADESKNILEITGTENVYGDITTETEVGEFDNWDQIVETTETVTTEIEEPIIEEITFQINGLSPESSYSIDINYIGNGRTMVNGLKTIEYMNAAIQATPIVITQRTQEFFSLDPDAIDEDLEYKKEFGFNYVSILQYVDSGYEMFTPNGLTEIGKRATFSISRDDFIVNQSITPSSFIAYKNGVYQTDKGRTDTTDPYQNVTRVVLGDYSILGNVILSENYSGPTDKLFYDTVTSGQSFLDISDWSIYTDGVIPSIETSGRVFFMNGQKILEDQDYTTDANGKFKASTDLQGILGTLSSVIDYLFTVTAISQSQILTERVFRDYPIIYLNGIRIDPENVIEHTSIDNLGGKPIKLEALNSLIDESSDKLQFWE